MAAITKILSPATHGMCFCVIRRTLASTSELYRLKSEWRRDRKPAHTKLSDENDVERRKAFGGREKWKAKGVSEGKYRLASQSIENVHKIIDVVHSDAGKYYRENKVMVKGTYVVVDASPLKHAINIDQVLSGSCDEGTVDNIPPNVASHINDMYNNGCLYAKVRTRPGQVGACDGDIVEGAELITLLDKLKMYEDVKES